MPELGRGGIPIRSSYNSAALLVTGSLPPFAEIRSINVAEGRYPSWEDEAEAVGIIIKGWREAMVNDLSPTYMSVPGSWSDSLPTWFPEPVRHANQVVLFVLDGLGWDQLQERPDVAPTIAAYLGTKPPSGALGQPLPEAPAEPHQEAPRVAARVRALMGRDE